MNTNDFFELKKSYDTSQMPEKEVIKMKEKMNQAKAEKKNKHNKTIITRIWVGAAAAIAAFVILPNTSPSVAYAMEQIPLLGNLIEVVTFRDYQYSSDRNNADVNVPKLVPETVASTEKTTEDPVGENLKKSTDEINAEIEKISDSLIAAFKQNMNNEGYQDIMIKHEVINTTDDYFTLKLMCYQAAGSGYEMDYYYTIDLKTRERLALKDLFKEGSDYITPISENIKSQMRGQMDADENVSYWLDDTEVPEWNFTSINDDTSFYINADGNLVISFNEGDVGPMSMGVVEFTIPHDVIADILK